MSLRSILARLLGVAPPAPAPEVEDVEPGSRLLAFGGNYSTHTRHRASKVREWLQAKLDAAAPQLLEGAAMDGVEGSNLKLSLGDQEVSEALFGWYGAQVFIGHQLCAIIATHWLVNKACSMPGRDAIRQGFTIALEGAETDDKELAAIKKLNKKFRINKQMQEYIRFSRVFGIRIAIFKVESSDPKYYEQPFNIDGVTPGSYKGIVQVDPYWCSPELDLAAVSDPSSPDFYDPTWWRVNGQRYHRSHLAICRTAQPADVLKPSYMYGGVPLPQAIMERVYAAERTANEAPQLAMTKRLTVWGTEIAELLGNQERFLEHMINFEVLRDNYGIKINDTGDTMEQFDTTLTGLDETIMSQYQLVAAIAHVPATKLLATAPKGLNATGEYDESSYHEELETIQENDLTPMLERHLDLVLRSEIEPQFALAPGTLSAVINWEPLDSPTAEEYANINLKKAQADVAWAGIGAIDGMDVRRRLQTERDSGYYGIADASVAAEDPLDAAIRDLQGGGTDPLAEATAALQAHGAGGGDPLEAATRALAAPAPVLSLEHATAALSG